jgi:hypothetical protein
MESVGPLDRVLSRMNSVQSTLITALRYIVMLSSQLPVCSQNSTFSSTCLIHVTECKPDYRMKKVPA